MENIFIFRMAKGNDSGTPIGHCPLDYTDIKKEIAKLKQEDIKQIQYEDEDFKKLYIEFLYKELWNNNILRQGWGIKDLDLNQETPIWIKNYMYNGKIFWNTDIECNTAKGRWNIITRMRDMKKDDFIIIPKTSNNIDKINDYEHFAICQVDEPYYFDYPEHIKDFGHCIKVKNLKKFEYSNKTLLRNDFSAPYLWAITKVESTHSRYDKFRNFCKNQY